MVRAGIAAVMLWVAVLGCGASIHARPPLASSTTPARLPSLAEARRGIEEGYRRNRAAMLAKDIEAVMALRTEDFYSLTPDGQRHDRAAMQGYISNFLNGVERWIHLSEKIQSLTLNGLEADATTRQHAVRMHLRNDNKVHHVETWVTQRERWRLTLDGWKLAMVDSVRDQKRLVDGRPG